MKLPKEFVERMTTLLGEEEREVFFASFDQPRHYGLRVNTLKITVPDFLARSPFPLTPVPWTKNGFYYPAEERPAKHPYYFAGLYYLQEPSAMAPGAVIKATPGERILDLAAAPGGKTTQMAADMKGEGLLVANDVSAERAKALTKNIELFGITNAVILNETPERLAQKLPVFFDKILVDAPCSGEGMFRKDPNATSAWGVFSVNTCAALQRNILEHAAAMLKPGGHLVYSTCTFAPEENEGTLEYFLSRHPEFNLEPVPGGELFSPGCPVYVNGREELKRAARLWPHKIRGEGHFVALLRKKPGVTGPSVAEQSSVHPDSLADFHSFVAENLIKPLTGRFIRFGDHLYKLPPGTPSLEGLKVVRPGWYMGMFKKNRFAPSQALAMGLRREDVVRAADFAVDDPRVIRYLKGETLPWGGEAGWTLVAVDGFPLGWGKAVQGQLKNHYPRGWLWVD